MRALVLLMVVVSLGCYKYVPTTLESVSPNEDVRVMLSTEGELNLRERTGLEGGELEGELLESENDRLLLAVKSASAFPELGSGSLYQRVDIPRQAVLRVERRKVDALRVGALVAIIGGGAAFAIARGFQKGRGEEATPEPGGPEDHRARGFLIGIPMRIP